VININSGADTQILKQQKQLKGMIYHIPININTEHQWTQLPHQKTTFFQTGLKRKN
jgi:hypothetical protein